MPSRPCLVAGWSMPTGLQLGDRVRDGFLRHAGHRVVRDDDGRLQAAAAGAGEADSGHAERRPRACRRSRRRFIYTQLVPVESTTLVLMIVAASLGAWLGAGVVVHWPRRRIQIGMGVALLGAATLMLMPALSLFPGGGDTLEPHRRAARHRPGRQLRARRADDARHRPLCAVHDSGQPARHESGRGVSDHDGIVRVPDADQHACSS